MNNSNNTMFIDRSNYCINILKNDIKKYKAMSDNKESKMEKTESANITGHKLEKSSFEAKVHRGILFQEY